MSKPFRVVDTDVREGCANIAFDAALIELHKAGEIGDTIRFLQFRPTALVGRHQALAQELRLDYCRERGIGISRRITGGGALYMDEGQFGFELVFHRKTLGLATLADLTREICEATAAGLQRLGLDARFRPRNDIEVGGRKVSGTGGFFDGDTLFYQGTILVEMDAERMLATLNVPDAKIARRGLASAAHRVATLRELLGDAVPSRASVKTALLEGFAERLGIEPRWGEIDPREESAAERWLLEEIGTAEFIHGVEAPAEGASVLKGVRAGAGGTITVYVRLEGASLDRFREVLITGDFFVTPPRVILDLEASLRGSRIGEARAHIREFFARADVGALSASADEFAEAIESALAAGKAGRTALT